MHAPNDYLQLSNRFSAVRHAWKRAAALSGLAVVATESIGIFTAILFLDWLYQPEALVRLALWAVALAVIGYFLVRHVVKPLVRKIPDEQIALYIEENRSELDGVLITAAEFGPKRGKGEVSSRESSLIDAVLNEAVTRTSRVQVGKLADFSRLKKYGILAAGGIAVYVLAGILFPAAFAHQLGRVLQPWQETSEDIARHAAAAAQAEPLKFTLSKTDASLARGSSFDFEVTLSKAKPADQAVTLFFRPKAGGDWQKLPMTEIEKLNSFQGSLPDVSEDLDFYVACGDAKSATCHLAVYDPLVVRSMAITTHFPDYVKQPDRVENPSTGDVTALAGSQATLKIVTSTPIKTGQIKWSGGQTQSVTVDSQGVATVTFEVRQDDTYDYALTDVNGQQAISAAPLAVHAIPDTPPSVTLKSPEGQVLTNPLGEINFDVEAGDDFGVVALDLVYTRIDAKGNETETRVPLTYHATGATDMANAVAATYRLALEDINPPFQPGDTVPYHVEARDAKGQVTSSPIGMLLVGYFEHWGIFAAPTVAGTAVHDETGASLLQMVALAWELDNQKTQIKPDDLKTKSGAIAGKLVNADGTVRDFLSLEEHPERAAIAPFVNAHIKKAHDALMGSDTSTGLAQLSVAAAILTANGIKPDSQLASGAAGTTIVGNHEHSPTMTLLEQARLTALAAVDKDKSHAEDDPADAAATAQQVADLLKQQDALVAHAQALESSLAAQKKGANGAPPPAAADKGSGSGTGNAQQPTPADLAAKEHAIAQQTTAAAQTQAAAGSNARNQAAADKTAAAARKMEEAARDFAAGKTQEGHDKAAEAQATLQAAGDALQNTDRDKLAAAIGDAAAHAALLLEKQKELSTDTDALARDLAGKTADQRQQLSLKEQAYRQTQLGAQAEALDSEITHLGAQAQQVGQADAIRSLGDALQVIKHKPPQAKLAGAVVDLTNADPTSAGVEQKAAIDAIQKLSDSLQSGTDALAASREAQLNRANRVAQDAKQGLNALLGTQPGEKPGAQAGTQASKQPGEQPGKQAGTEAGKQPGEKPGAQAGDQPTLNGGGSRLDEARKLAYNLTQLTAAVDGRQLIDQDKVDQLKEMSMDKAALEKRLTVDPKFLQDVSNVVTSISDKIEAELEAKTEASKLYSSQREECPPGYRPFVNKYFEALSQVAPSSQPAPAPAPAATAPAPAP